MFLALDPGETTGWAHLGAEGFPKHLDPHGQSMGQVAGQKGLSDLLEAIETPPRVLIYEEFRVRGQYKNHFGKELITVQNIGIIKSYAYRNNIELVKQEPSRKSMGYGWAQITPAGNHRDSHRRDAMAHAVYYVVTNKIRPILRSNS